MGNSLPAAPEKERASAFTAGLLQWNKTQNKRQMPWKGEKDPYKIWLSEIILQQTRVEQGLNYYKRFTETFPTVTQLAQAPEQQVFKLWEGLGYYNRCRNLIATARYISESLGGRFPADYESILQLKGIGAYTAAAIASFAYNLPHAVLDGNVFRVLSRIFDIDVPIDATEGKKYFSNLAQSLLPPGEGGNYNQAIMDFGATLCKPKPECAICFFKNNCAAFLHKKQLLLPVKGKKQKVKDRWFNYFLFRYNGNYALRQRTEKDIWQSLYEFLLIETPARVTTNELLVNLQMEYGFKREHFGLITPLKDKLQRLTHQLVHFSFVIIELKEDTLPQPLQWVPRNELVLYPFPKLVEQIIKQLVLLRN